MVLVPSERREMLNETLYNLYTTLNSFGIMLFRDVCNSCTAVQLFGMQKLGEQNAGKTSAVSTSLPNSCTGLHLLHTAHGNVIPKLLSTVYKL